MIEVSKLSTKHFKYFKSSRMPLKMSVIKLVTTRDLIWRPLMVFIYLYCRGSSSAHSLKPMFKPLTFQAGLTVHEFETWRNHTGCLLSLTPVCYRRITGMQLFRHFGGDDTKQISNIRISSFYGALICALDSKTRLGLIPLFS